jgi:hypothetical protein
MIANTLKVKGLAAKVPGFTGFMNYFQMGKAVHPVYMARRPCDGGGAPVHHGPGGGQAHCGCGILCGFF